MLIHSDKAGQVNMSKDSLGAGLRASLRDPLCHEQLKELYVQSVCSRLDSNTSRENFRNIFSQLAEVTEYYVRNSDPFMALENLRDKLRDTEWRPAKNFASNFVCSSQWGNTRIEQSRSYGKAIDLSELSAKVATMSGAEKDLVIDEFYRTQVTHSCKYDSASGTIKTPAHILVKDASGAIRPLQNDGPNGLETALQHMFFRSVLEEYIHAAGFKTAQVARKPKDTEFIPIAPGIYEFTIWAKENKETVLTSKGLIGSERSVAVPLADKVEEVDIVAWFDFFKVPYTAAELIAYPERNKWREFSQQIGSNLEWFSPG